jgi:hypothetical protein
MAKENGRSFEFDALKNISEFSDAKYITRRFAWQLESK